MIQHAVQQRSHLAASTPDRAPLGSQQLHHLAQSYRVVFPVHGVALSAVLGWYLVCVLCATPLDHVPVAVCLLSAAHCCGRRGVACCLLPVACFTRCLAAQSNAAVEAHCALCGTVRPPPPPPARILAAVDTSAAAGVEELPPMLQEWSCAFCLTPNGT